MRRAGRHGIAGQPALLGAATVLLAIFAVYISYHADSGLPLKPTYDVQVVIPDAEHFGKTGDVRLAGVLVGRVGERRLEVRPDGTTRAVLDLALNKDIEPLPADTTVRMRANSTLGGNYVELLPGKSPDPLRGSPPVIRADDAPREISLSDALEAYDKKTRGAMGRYLGGAGTALTGRGIDLNAIIRSSPSALEHLEGAAGTMAAPSSDLAGFVDGWSRLAGAVAPVAEQQAGFFRGLDGTFGALASVRGDVADATSESPPLLEAGTRGFASQRALLGETRELFAVLRPGFASLRSAADDIRGASVGSPRAFRSLRPLAPRLANSGRSLSRFALDPVVVPAVGTLTDTFGSLAPTVSDLRDAQVVCNYPGVALRNLMSVLSEGASSGNFVNVGAVLVLPGPDGEAGPAVTPAHGPAEREDNYLHSTVTPLVGVGSSPECEAGNETYAIGQQAIGNAPGAQPARTETARPGRPR